MGKWDGVLYLMQHHHRESDFCIKMGSNESHFSVSFSAMGRVTRQWPCLHRNLRMERRSKAGNQEGLRVLLITTDLIFFFFLSSLQRLETQGGSERSPRLRYLDGPGPSSHSPDSPVPLSRSGAHPLTPSLSVTRDSHQSLVGHRPQNFNSNQSQVGLPACVLEGRVVGVWGGGGGGCV